MGDRQNIRSTDRDKDVRIIRVYVSLCTLPWWALGANHWAVLLELSNGQYASVQKFSKVGLHVRNSLRDVAILNWGDSKKIRLSCYGSSNYSWEAFYNSIEDESYFLLFYDCQTFARKIVDMLTDKYVGVFPIEDGPVYFR